MFCVFVATLFESNVSILSSLNVLAWHTLTSLSTIHARTQAFSLAGTSKLAGSSVWNNAALRGPKFREDVCPHLLAPQGKLLVVRMEDLTGAALGASNAKTATPSSASGAAASDKTLATQRVMDLVNRCSLCCSTNVFFVFFNHVT